MGAFVAGMGDLQFDPFAYSMGTFAVFAQVGNRGGGGGYRFPFSTYRPIYYYISILNIEIHICIHTLNCPYVNVGEGV